MTSPIDPLVAIWDAKLAFHRTTLTRLQDSIPEQLLPTIREVFKGAIENLLRDLQRDFRELQRSDITIQTLFTDRLTALRTGVLHMGERLLGCRWAAAFTPPPERIVWVHGDKQVHSLQRRSPSNGGFGWDILLGSP